MNMSITDFINFLEEIGIKAPIYPQAFPAKADAQSVMIEIGQGFNSRGDVSDITLTTTIRAEHPSEAEQLAQTINNLLTDVTDKQVGMRQVILIKAQQLIPNYLGRDTDGLHYYMNNFRVLVG